MPNASHEGRRPFLKRSRHQDRKSTRLNSSHSQISYAVFCLKKKNHIDDVPRFIWADGSKLRQIFISLIGNAVQFTEHRVIVGWVENERVATKAISVAGDSRT